MRTLALTLLIGCAPEVPASPSFQQDVLPITAANCVRCHGFPVLKGAPREFRLDSFADVAVTDGVPGAQICGDFTAAQVVICGAATSAAAISSRLNDDELPVHPPYPLDDYQLETLENWGRDPRRGEPRPNNAVPTIATQFDQDPTIITVRVQVDDADGDLVVGSLLAADRLVGPLRTGMQELRWDVSGIPAGELSLSANLDDGAQVHVVALGTITIGEP